MKARIRAISRSLRSNSIASRRSSVQVVSRFRWAVARGSVGSSLSALERFKASQADWQWGARTTLRGCCAGRTAIDCS